MEPLAARLAEIDKLKMQLLSEKQVRIQMEMQNLKMVEQRLQQEHALVQMENQALSKEMAEKYGLKPNDTVDRDGGITRAPVEQAA